VIRSAIARVRELFDRKRIARDLDEELELHLQLEIENNIKHGMAPDEARRAAALAFGGVQRYREETRAARGFERVESILRDTRFALRRLRRAPVFSIGVVGTLAIGIGAAGGVGALVYGVMLRPLPYPDPDRLVRVSIATPGMGIPSSENSSGTYVFFRERVRSFSAIGVSMENEGVVLTDRDAPERVVGAMVSPTALALLGTRPLLGRLFTFDDGIDDTPTMASPVLLSYDVWQRRYGGDSSIVGKFIEISRRKRPVIGVLPKDFDFPSRRVALYFPDNVQATRAGLGDRYLTVVGRLQPGVSVRQAQSEIDALIAHFHERFPELSAADVQRVGLSARVQTLREALAEPVRGELMLLAIMVAVVLLIATTNVATLYLLRAERLHGEVGVSRALGASQSALTQRFVVEGIVVALAGGLVSVPIVAIAVMSKLGFTPGEVPRLHEVALSPVLLLGLLVLSLAVGIGLGVIASWRASGGVASDALRADARATPSRAWRRAQESLVSIQIALALALLLAAGLMASSLARLQRVDIGFKAEGASVFSLTIPRVAYPSFARTVDFHARLIDALKRVPGVTGAAYGMQFPSTPQLLSSHPRLERETDASTQVAIDANVVSPEFFRVMHMPMRAGRSFERGDLTNPTPAVVIGETLARDLFGNGDPLGQTVRLGGSTRYPAYRVVGVVGDVYSDRITDGVLRVAYFPSLADYAASDSVSSRIPFVPAGGTYVVRSDLPFERLGPELRRAVASIDPRVPIWGSRTLESLVAASTARVRLTMLLLAVAAAATLLLGAIGLYSVIAYAVAGRAPEFAIRLALGATPDEIMALVFRRGLLVAVVGVAAGVVLALGGSRLIRGILYEVSATDPFTYAAATVVVLLAVVAATYVPARRAGEADPAKVLRGA
jgi:predicted permease